MITSKGDSKMSARRVKTSGWAAFDLKQRQKDGIVAESGDELFPSLGTTITSLQPCKTSVRDKHVKSFSSAIQPSLHFPTLIQDNIRSKSSEVGSSENHQISELSLEVKSSLVFKQLKEIFVWADDSLIEDVIAATGNDVDKASSFLKAMVSDQRSHELEITEEENHTKLICKKEDESLKDVHEPAKMCSVTEPCLGSKNNNVSNDFAENLYNDYMEINAILGQLTSIPVEPEWEEDDVYLSCRKDAIKKIRAATRHSKAATNSFLRGDHKSAQQFSLKAREDWGAAQSLNAKAACEILRIRNENNGIWRLDLHGLHASEAVEAVKKRLFMIETHFLSKGSRHSELPNSSKSMPVNKSEEHASYRLKPIWLEVITGIGNHSRGGAALPTAVRTFLADNGYRFDEARPGVIMVRPKFRANGMT